MLFFKLIIQNIKNDILLKKIFINNGMQFGKSCFIRVITDY